MFKSSFDQDVNAWADIKLSTNGQGQHVLLQQAFSKLASIQSESKQLFKIAQKGLTALQTLHNNINARSQQTDNGLQDKPKHEKLLFRDQQVALKMTLRIAEQYRENYFSRTLDYYKSLFDVSLMHFQMLFVLVMHRSYKIPAQHCVMAFSKIPGLKVSWKN